MPGTRKLGRPTAHRNAMLRGQVTYLFKYGKVETTVTRAKEVRAVAEKMITLGKQNTIAARRARIGTLFILPFIVGFLVFMAKPLFLSMQISLSKYTIQTGEMAWNNYLNEYFENGAIPMDMMEKFLRDTGWLPKLKK